MTQLANYRVRDAQNLSTPALLSYIPAAITLEPGDLVLTGTPAGVGPLKAGDRTDVSIEGLGVLSSTFALEQG